MGRTDGRIRSGLLKGIQNRISLDQNCTTQTSIALNVLRGLFRYGFQLIHCSFLFTEGVGILSQPEYSVNACSQRE